MAHAGRTAAATLLAIAMTGSLAACASGDQQSGEEAGAGSDVPASTAPIVLTTPSVEPKQVEPVVTEDIGERIDDPGLNLTYQLVDVRPGNYGGLDIVVNVLNKNEAPLSPDLLTTEYRYNDSSGGTEYARADVLEVQDEAFVGGLDVPLGAGAEVNLTYPYDVTFSTAYDAEFRIGNVTFKGNLTPAVWG